MHLPIVIIIALFLGLVGYFYKKGDKIKQDAEAANESFSWGKFLKENALDIILSVVLAVTAITAADVQDIIPNADVTSVLGALATGAGIPSVAVNYLLGIFGAGDKSRRKLRKAIDLNTGPAKK